MLAHLTAHTDLRAASIEDFGASYAETLRRWRSRIFGRLEDVRRLGYSDEFIRMWHYYLCYCEGAFLESATGVVHMLLVRPRYLRAGDGC
jgi:cyclopropane-fatty-acyl-phospholipid synthase